MKTLYRFGLTLICALPLTVSSAARPPSEQARKEGNVLARDIFKELIEINTTDSIGNVTTAAQAMRARFRAAGFEDSDLVLAGPNERKQNLVVRYHGKGRHRPVLFIGHLDVVEALRADWSTDPFQFVEKDGYFYGRGTQDMKDGDAIMVATLMRLKQEHFQPSRDIILALTADEEGGASNGPTWLIKNRPELIDAEFVINHDGNSIISLNGTPQLYDLSATEKVYADYVLIASNRGGHSSEPRADNAIYELAAALERLQQFHFPLELNEVTRAFYEKNAALESGQRAADMRAILKNPQDAEAGARLSQDVRDRGMLHTTCVATRLNGGHANNALPQTAQANINCRIIPGHSPEETRQTLISVIADPKIKVRAVDNSDGVTMSDSASTAKGYPPPPLHPVMMKALTTAVARYWPGLVIIPSQSSGASDGIFFSAINVPVYCITGIDIDRNDSRAHGQDERLKVDSFDRGNEFFYDFTKLLTAQ